MDWDQYWQRAANSSTPSTYERIARFYRRQIISRSTVRILSQYFRDEGTRRYLHAGCGSGGSDQRIHSKASEFHFLDLSERALTLHLSQPLSLKRRYVCGNIFSLPYSAKSMDGLFNLGVMEHFTESDLGKILTEFHRVLKDRGTLVLFWPPEFGLSVMALKLFHATVNRFRKVPLKLHPDEISRIPSFQWVREKMNHHHFDVVHLEFGWKDLFTHVAVVARKTRPNAGLTS